MAQLIYAAIASLDGYIEDETGSFDWAAPDEEVHAFVNDLERPVGTYLYGRRMYETMVVLGDRPGRPTSSPDAMRDFAEIWRAADKVVYSKTLESASTARTRIERDFDPEAVRQLKASAHDDLGVGGPSSRRRRSEPGSWTSATSSSCRSSWAAASGRCRTASGWSSTCSTSAVSGTAPSSCATA